MNIGVANSSSSFKLISLDSQKKEFSYSSGNYELLRDAHCHLLTFNPELNQELEEILKEEEAYSPIMPFSALPFSVEDLEKDSFASVHDTVDKLYKAWVYKNNLNSVKNLYAITNHLKGLWSKDRDNFFEELWFFLKRNLGTHYLNILFHNLKENENAKDELIFASTKGEKRQETFTVSGAEKELLLQYEKQLDGELRLLESSKNGEESVLGIKVKLSPILIMAKGQGLNSLNMALVESVLNSLDT